MIKLLILISSFALNVIGSSLESTLEESLTPLMQAINASNLDQVKKLLESETNINKQDSQGRTALFIAAQNGENEILKELLKHKDIDIDKADRDGMTPLQVAVANNNPDAVQALLDACKSSNKCAEINQRDTKLKLTPLVRAVQSGYQEIIKLLLNYGANPTLSVQKTVGPVSIIDLYKDEDATKELLKNKAKEYDDRAQEFMNALGLDRSKRDYKKAGELLKLGINSNFKDEENHTPLHNAAKAAYKEGVEALIKAGAAIDVKDNRGWTPLNGAAWEQIKDNRPGIEQDISDVVQMLIAAGADVNTKSKDSFTPLLGAAHKGNTEAVKMLIKAGADINAQDYAGDAPLHNAQFIPSKDVVYILINSGANVNIKNKDGETPLMRAARGHQEDIVDLLINAGANLFVKDKYGKTAQERASTSQINYLLEATIREYAWQKAKAYSS